MVMNNAARAERNGIREAERRAREERVAIGRAHLDKVMAEIAAADAARNAASKAATNLQMGELFSVKQMAENPSLHDMRKSNYPDIAAFFNQPGRWFVRTQNGKSKIVFVEHCNAVSGWVSYRRDPYNKLSFEHDTPAKSSGITYALMNPSNLAKVVAIAVQQNGGKRRNTRKNRRNSRNSRNNRNRRL